MLTFAYLRAHTDDPLDPRNWTRLQQSTILAIVYFAYFTSTYLVSVASSPSPFLKNRFQATTTNLHWMSTVPSLGLATSPLLGPILASRYGRRIVLVLGAAIALVASGCTSILSVHGLSSRGYLAARFFQGFGMGPAFNVGLAVVGDLSWEDERGVRVGLWALAGNLGLCVGGLSKPHSLSMSIPLDPQLRRHSRPAAQHRRARMATIPSDHSPRRAPRR